MASIEFITKRVEGKQKEVAKLEKKLERILKAQATGWEVNPYYYHEDDVKWTTRDLEQARKALEEYKEQLIRETEKANSRNVKVIIEFLENWKERMRKAYANAFTQYLDALEEYYKVDREYCEWYNSRRKWDECTREEIKAKEKAFHEYRSEFRKTWAFVEIYDEYNYGKHTFNTAKFEKDLENDANAKYDDIIRRTNEIVGEITDAKALSVGEKGELNGYIIGTRGTAKVNTIGAGGYNIQIFHFRTLIHRVK